MNKKYCNRLVDLDEIKALKDLKKQVTFLKRLRIEDEKWCEEVLHWTNVGEEEGEDVYAVDQIDLENNVQTWNSKIHQIPENIKNIKHLDSLDLSWNQLINLPETIGNLPNIKTLRLNNNRLEEIPKEIGKLTNIEELSLRHNNLTDLPEDFKYLVNLKDIDLSHNPLATLPKGILSSKERIESLNLAYTNLEKIPEILGEFSNLRHLYVNGIAEYATDKPLDVLNVSKIKKLETFIANTNSIPLLPEDIGTLKNLKKLDLRVNKIKKLPRSFSKLTNLEEVNVAMNNLEDFPDLSKFEKVETFFIDIESPNKELLKNLPNASKRLHFGSGYGKKALKDFPDNLKNLSQTPIIHLSARKTTELNKSLGDLTDVEELNLLIPEVTHIAPEFKKLRKLKNLQMDLNQIDTFDNFPRSLERLYISSIKMRKLPADIKQLSNLRVLQLPGCWNLKELPDLSSMNLKVLDFRGKKPKWAEGIPTFEDI